MKLVKKLFLGLVLIASAGNMKAADEFNFDGYGDLLAHSYGSVPAAVTNIFASQDEFDKLLGKENQANNLVFVEAILKDFASQSYEELLHNDFGNKVLMLYNKFEENGITEPSDSAASEDVWDGSLVEVEKRLFDYYISTDESLEDIYSDLLLWNFEEKREKLIASGMML